MKIYLINPLSKPSVWNFHYAKDLVKFRYSHPPLALATLSALTPEGIEVILCDENTGAIDFHSDADIVGITSMLFHRERAYEIADIFLKKGKTVCIGGPLVDYDREEALKHCTVLFKGEAEYTWPRFIHDFLKGEPSRIYEEKGFPHLKDSPVPAFPPHPRDHYSTGIVQASRGCPHGCEFCDTPLYSGRVFRAKPLENILKEVEQMYGFGYESIFFSDDGFNGDRNHTLALLKELSSFVKRVHRNVYFFAQVSIDIAKDEEMLELMHQANLHRVFVGLESPRVDNLISLNKKKNLGLDLISSVHTIQSYNITVWAGIVLGFDFDTESLKEELLDFLEQTSIPVVLMGLLYAPPGTPLHEKLKEQGRIDLASRFATSLKVGSAEYLLETNIIPARMAKKDLIVMYREILREAYRYDSFLNKMTALLSRFSRPAKITTRSYTLRSFLVFARTAFYFLFENGKEGRAFFVKGVLKLFLKYWKYSPEILVNTVMFKHLHVFYNQVADQPLPESLEQESIKESRAKV